MDVTAVPDHPKPPCAHLEMAFLAAMAGVVCVVCGATWLRKRSHPERGLPVSRLLRLLDDPASAPPSSEAPHL